jgi:hypothetical protein
MCSSELSFEEWFTTLSNFKSRDELWDCDIRMNTLPPGVIATYLERLLIHSPTLCAEMDPDQLGFMIWFFQGRASEYWCDVRGKGVTEEQQIATVTALEIFYTEFLDPYFVNSRLQNIGEAGDAVYMMWDMGCLEGAAMFPGSEHLVEPILNVLSAALQCKSYECQRSALHGLGHLQGYHPDRVEREIDQALKRSGHTKPILLEYAKEARRGMVQ